MYSLGWMSRQKAVIMNSGYNKKDRQTGCRKERTGYVVCICVVICGFCCAHIHIG